MSKADLLRQVEEAGFVFRGRVVAKDAPGAPLAAGEGKAVRVEVEQIVRSSEALRGLVGKQVIVLSGDRSALEEGAAFFFFTRVVALGDHVVVRESGHMKSLPQAVEEVAEAAKRAEERPLRERLADAELIITGIVVSSHRAEEASVLRSEHDPEWWIADVRVRSTLKGKKAQAKIEVLFANSTDIAWYRAPKLHEDAQGVLLLRRPKEGDSVPKAAHAVYQVTDPLDFLPMERLSEVERLLEQDTER
jgi:hypothetical protein